MIANENTIYREETNVYSLARVVVVARVGLVPSHTDWRTMNQRASVRFAIPECWNVISTEHHDVPGRGECDAETHRRRRRGDDARDGVAPVRSDPCEDGMCRWPSRSACWRPRWRMGVCSPSVSGPRRPVPFPPRRSEVPLRAVRWLRRRERYACGVTRFSRR